MKEAENKNSKGKNRDNNKKDKDENENSQKDEENLFKGNNHNLAQLGYYEKNITRDGKFLLQMSFLLF